MDGVVNVREYPRVLICETSSDDEDETIDVD